jgi:hypothetical protein
LTKKYIFRREDNDALIEVPFDKMIEQDSLGCIKLDCGATARRCRYLEEPPAPPKEGATQLTPRPLVSDALGCCSIEVEVFREDARRNGHIGVEWKPDPLVKGFYQCHFSGPEARERYLRHRQMSDRSKKLGSGATLSEEDLRKAAELVERNLTERQGAR